MSEKDSCTYYGDVAGVFSAKDIRSFGTYELPAVESRSDVPQRYRLIKRGSEYILQGAFIWTRGFAESRIDWEDLPTIIE